MKRILLLIIILASFYFGVPYSLFDIQYSTRSLRVQQAEAIYSLGLLGRKPNASREDSVSGISGLHANMRDRYKHAFSDALANSV